MIESMYQPYDLCGLTPPSRWAMAPMTRKKSPGRSPTITVAEHYRRRAAGGVGLIITEGTLVDHPLASADSDIPQITPATVDAWRGVVDAVHREGAGVFLQLWHQGPVARPGISATRVMEDGREVVAKADSQQEQSLADAFVRSADSARAAGFDGVELHGAHAYLLDSFLRAGRVDYLCDVVNETRSGVGAELILALRFSQWTVRDHAARQFDSPQQLERALLPLKEAGIDVFHASTRRFWVPEFADSDLNLAGWTRNITDAPTITVGNIGLVTSQFCGDGPESAGELQRRFDRGEFDMAAIGRPLISDAEWCDKVRDGRTDAIVDYTSEANEIYP